MELNREQIVKALECCSKDDCDNCPNGFGNCYANLAGYALALIREAKYEVLMDFAERLLDTKCKICNDDYIFADNVKVILSKMLEEGK